MRYPVKANRSMVPRWLAPLIPAVHDPKNIILGAQDFGLFDDGIESIKIDSTWKTTAAGRHPITDAAICEIARGMTKPTVIDVGSSSGLTSVELIERLGEAFGRFYATDLYFSVPYEIENDVTYFYHPVTGKCIIRSGRLCVAYADFEGSAALFRVIARRLLRGAPTRDSTGGPRASLVHPRLKALISVDSRVTTELFSVLNPWHRAQVDIIKVANVLNKGYFSNTQLLSAIDNLRGALNAGGTLLVTDNRSEERISIFSRGLNGALVQLNKINGGAEISELM